MSQTRDQTLSSGTTLNLPRQRIHSDGGRFFEASVKQNFLLGSIEVGYSNTFGAEIRPVKVLIDPVHCNSHRSLDIVYDFLVGANLPTFVQRCAERTKRKKQSLKYYTFTQVITFSLHFRIIVYLLLDLA